jgi:SulP family sulfate permease
MTRRRVLLPGLPTTGYGREEARSDLVGGITVAVMLIPQAMAYATLAGMPPVTGLYAALVPLVAYALFGTSGQLAVGPVALMALLTADGLADFAGGDLDAYVAGAATLALMVGAIHVLLGVLRAGALVNFLSHEVISAFTSAAALVIGLSQVRSLLGMDLPRPDGFLGGILDITGALDLIDPTTATVGLGAVAFLALGRRWRRRWPWPLLAAGAAAAIVGLLDVPVRIVGEVPSGLPTPALPSLDPDTLLALLPTAATIAIIGYLEGVSVAKALDDSDSVDADRELLGIGAANLAAGFFGAFPVAGGFSRSAVSAQAGSRTVLSGVITAAAIAITLLFLTPLFHDLPTAVLAAIIVVAVTGLLDFGEPRHTWKVRRSDFFAWLLTFGATLLIDVEVGIAVGAGFGLLAFIQRSAQPHITELGRVRGTDRLFRNVDRFDTEEDPTILLARIDGPLYFANAKFIRDWFVDHVQAHPDCRTLIIDASAISDMDSSSIRSMRELEERLHARGIDLHLAAVRGPVQDVLARSGTWQESRATAHADVATAVRAVAGPDSALRKSSEEGNA